ncbi:hypothetical protein BKP37_08540 [Anaerobacillus alkalilacustris]|uniref:Uncharacterized protein n=1 Tax=Anaerobacillus alkalilacustris TaxID=393763 RepID=A0A1S2LPV6_9BACI|nr:hypothetical protein BKP37_08540 [Anaerobacillus alkalilacustris]
MVKILLFFQIISLLNLNLSPSDRITFFNGEESLTTITLEENDFTFWNDNTHDQFSIHVFNADEKTSIPHPMSLWLYSSIPILKINRLLMIVKFQSTFFLTSSL